MPDNILVNQNGCPLVNASGAPIVSSNASGCSCCNTSGGATCNCSGQGISNFIVTFSGIVPCGVLTSDVPVGFNVPSGFLNFTCTVPAYQAFPGSCQGGIVYSTVPNGNYTYSIQVTIGPGGQPAMSILNNYQVYPVDIFVAFETGNICQGTNQSSQSFTNQFDGSGCLS